MAAKAAIANACFANASAKQFSGPGLPRHYWQKYNFWLVTVIKIRVNQASFTVKANKDWQDG